MRVRKNLPAMKCRSLRVRVRVRVRGRGSRDKARVQMNKSQKASHSNEAQQRARKIARTRARARTRTRTSDRQRQRQTKEGGRRKRCKGVDEGTSARCVGTTTSNVPHATVGKLGIRILQQTYNMIVRPL